VGRVVAVATVLAWLLALAGSATPAAAAAGTTYFVDAVTGNDTGSGTSPATAWQTLAKVNATTFQPGDRILLHTDQRWAGQVHPLGSGAAGAPVTLSSYGGGARPRIDAGALAGDGACGGAAAVFFQDQQHWVVDGLEVTSDSGVDNLGSFTGTKGGHRVGICFTNGLEETLTDITIVNNFVHDVNGCIECVGYDGHDNGGIIVAAYDYWRELSSFDDVVIADNTISRVGRVGITVADWSSPNGGEPYYLEQSLLTTRVTIRGNALDSIDSDGIIVKGTDGALIEHNVVAGAGLKTVVGSTEPSAGGIWSVTSMNTVMQFNEVSGVKTQATDGQAFDIDAGSINTKVQYNYSHDNEGGFILLMGLGVGDMPSPSKDAIVRRNLSVNDAFPGVKGVFTFSYGVPERLQIENNTIYIPPGSPANPMYCDSCNPAAPRQWAFRNNVVENHGSGGYAYANQAGAVFDHNLYFGNHPATEPPEAGKLTADPQLVAPGGAAPADYRLQGTSPAIGAGALIDQSGGVDHFGNALSLTAAPSLGFHEAAAVAGPPVLIDGARDHLATAHSSPNLTIEGFDPASFGGDATRFVRSDTIPNRVRITCDWAQPNSFQPRFTDPAFATCHEVAAPGVTPDPAAGTVEGVVGAGPATATWLFEDMQSFRSTVYVTGGGLAGVSFSASTDGRTFSPVAITSTAPTPAGGVGWSVTTVTPASPLPPGTSWLRAQLAPTPTAAAQIGEIAISKGTVGPASVVPEAPPGPWLAAAGGLVGLAVLRRSRRPTGSVSST
jgi:hypothetical protein